MATTNVNTSTPFSAPLFAQVPQAVDALKQRLAALQQEELFIQAVLAHEGVPTLGMMPSMTTEVTQREVKQTFQQAPLTPPQMNPKPAKKKVGRPRITMTNVPPEAPVTVPNGGQVAVAAFTTSRRDAMEAFFRAGGHLTASNKDIGKRFHASKSLVSLYLNEAIEKGIATPRQGPGSRAMKA